jgi:hypothetical protein
MKRKTVEGVVGRLAATQVDENGRGRADRHFMNILDSPRGQLHSPPCFAIPSVAFLPCFHPGLAPFQTEPHGQNGG